MNKKRPPFLEALESQAKKEHGTKRKEANPLGAQRNSNQFRSAAQRCFVKRPISPTTYEMPAVAGIAILAFSIEIGFKSLLMRQGIEKYGFGRDGHDLAKLFGLLSVETQDRFVAKATGDRTAFDAEMVSAAHHFEKFRYAYESTAMHANFEFLRRVSDVLFVELDLPDLPTRP